MESAQELTQTEDKQITFLKNVFGTNAEISQTTEGFKIKNTLKDSISEGGAKY